MFLKEKKNWRAKSVQNFNDHEIKKKKKIKKTYEKLKRVCVEESVWIKRENSKYCISNYLEEKN